MTLVGVPGIGKSRLVYELSQVIEDEAELTSWRQGRSLPYGEGVSFWALGEMVKAQAGILETDSAEEAAGKLAQSVRAARGGVGGRLGRAAISARWSGSRREELEGDHRAEAFAAWRRFFEAIAEERPLVLVFEDLHWADEGLLDFVDHLVDWAGGVPILVVGTARPELPLAAQRLGRREAERPDAVAVAARRRPDGAPRRGAPRAVGPAGRDADGAPAAGGRKPALCRGVRPDGDRPRAR